jgi:tetratricopeptide (TPR) repeat protein
MSKMDKLLERMAQRRIESAVLVNDQPARFLVAGRETHGGVLPMSQLRSLIQEITPINLRWQLAEDSSFDFTYRSPDGIFTISVTGASSSLQVSIVPDFAAQARVAKSLCNEGVRLSQLGQFAAATRIFDDVEHRYAAVFHPDVQAQVARACKSRGTILFLMGAEQKSLAAFEEVVRRFGGDPHPAVQRQVIKALLNKAATLTNLNRSQDALTIYNNLLKHFAPEAHPSLRELMHEAMIERDTLLGAE